MGDPRAYADNSFFLNHLLKPYQDLFAANRAAALGQAKASAGNLTGSGYTNILGSATAQSLAGEDAQLADTMTQLRGQNLQAGQNQFGNILQFLLGYATHGAGQQQMYHSPGLFDAILPIAGQAAGAYFGNKFSPWNNQGQPSFGRPPVGMQPGFGSGGPSYGGPTPFSGQTY